MRYTVLAAVALTGVASAEIPIVESDDVLFSFGGYARAYSAWSRPLDAASRDVLSVPESVGVGAAILRSELKLNVMDIFGFDVHSRFFHLVQSDAVSANGAGIGVSTAPPRTVNLSTDLVRTDRFLLNHDVDRLAARFHLGPVDLVFGRQAITWGVGQIFPILDVWTSFSPFDLDTSQKRGVDGLRVTWAVSSTAELDFVVVDRGSWEDLSGGIRTVLYLDAVDIHLAFSKTWEELVLSTSVSATLGAFKLRAELAGIYDLDDAEIQRPRATLGVDWFATGNLIWSIEAHYSGLGASKATDYLRVASSDEVRRGELYLIGAAYVGTGISYQPHELITLGTTALVNLLDPSAMIGWSIAWAMQQDIELGLGGFHGVGAPTRNLQPQAEFSLYGQQVYLQFSAFF